MGIGAEHGNIILGAFAQAFALPNLPSRAPSAVHSNQTVDPDTFTLDCGRRNLQMNPVRPTGTPRR